MLCWFVLSTSCKPLSPHFLAPWQRSSSSSLLRDCFLKVYQLSLMCFCLLLSPSLHFLLSPSSVPFLSIPYPGGEPVDTVCQIFIGMGRSLSCPHRPQPLGTSSALMLFSFPSTFCFCSLAGELMGNGITESTGPVPFSLLFSFPALTSPSPLLVFEERLSGSGSSVYGIWAPSSFTNLGASSTGRRSPSSWPNL